MTRLRGGEAKSEEAEAEIEAEKSVDYLIRCGSVALTYTLAPTLDLCPLPPIDRSYHR
jgi:hypothetical protein